jgi:hypothetical protein
MPPAPPDDRVRVDGKQFSRRGRRFPFHGVTYGTFRPREDGERFPERGPAKLDFHAIADAGFTVVRTYTAPPDDIVELAADHDLRLLASAFYPDWRYLVGSSRRQLREIHRAAEGEVPGRPPRSPRPLVGQRGAGRRRALARRG